MVTTAATRYPNADCRCASRVGCHPLNRGHFAHGRAAFVADSTRRHPTEKQTAGRSAAVGAGARSSEGSSTYSAPETWNYQVSRVGRWAGEPHLRRLLIGGEPLEAGAYKTCEETAGLPARRVKHVQWRCVVVDTAR